VIRLPPMTAPASPPSPPDGALPSASPPSRAYTVVGVLTFLACVAVMLPLARHAAFHCDEANVLRHVSDFGLGDFSHPGRPGLLWLLLTPLLSLPSPDAVLLAARFVAAAASAATLALVWRLGDRIERGTGLVAMLLLTTSMSWQAHGFEVRTDTFVLPVTLFVIDRLWRAEQSTRDAVLVGIGVAVAGLFSQKSVYNAAAIGAGWLVLVLLRQIPLRLRMPLVAGGVTLALMAAWYGLLAALNAQDEMVSSNLSQAAANAFSEPRPLSQKLEWWSRAAARGPMLYVALPAGLLVAVTRARASGLPLAIAAVCLVMGSTVFVHRGFYMYFIASFEPYLAILGGAGIAVPAVAAARGFGPRGAAILTVVLTASFLGFAIHKARPHYAAAIATDNANQLQLARDVEEAFPEPVAYWDSIGLIPGYRETTFFGTVQNRTRLRKRLGGTAFVQLVRERKPLFFIRDYMTRDGFLTPPERGWLWRHFVPYRPNLHLRGGRVPAVAGERKVSSIEIVEPGPYTVRFTGDWDGRATFAGQALADGATVDVAEGTHELVAVAERGSGTVQLIVGADREPYTDDPTKYVDHTLYPILVRSRYQQYDRPRDEGFLLTPANDPVLATKTKKHQANRRKKHAKWQVDQDRRGAGLKRDKRGAR